MEHKLNAKNKNNNNKNLAFQEVVLKNITEVCAGDYSTQGAKGRVKTEPGCWANTCRLGDHQGLATWQVNLSTTLGTTEWCHTSCDVGISSCQEAAASQHADRRETLIRSLLQDKGETESRCREVAQDSKDPRASSQDSWANDREPERATRGGAFHFTRWGKGRGVFLEKKQVPRLECSMKQKQPTKPAQLCLAKMNKCKSSESDQEEGDSVKEWVFIV